MHVPYTYAILEATTTVPLEVVALAARPRKTDGPPLNEVSWSKRGLKTIYVKDAHKTILKEAAQAEGEPTVDDYLMKVHRFYQEHKTRA